MFGELPFHERGEIAGPDTDRGRLVDRVIPHVPVRQWVLTNGAEAQNTWSPRPTVAVPIDIERLFPSAVFNRSAPRRGVRPTWRVVSASV